MMKQKKVVLVTLCALVGVAASSQAEYLWGFGNVNMNYLDWSKSTENGSGGFKQDFAYLELEGGAAFSWGELYGFVDLEDVQGGSGSTRTATKGTISVKTGCGELRYYGQSYSTEDDGWHIRNNVAGFSYKLSGEAWVFAPYVGFHHTNTNGFVGMNGGMMGWFGMYNFDLIDQHFQITNWHETEFARSDDYIAIGAETDKLSANGALALWWHASEHISAGVQYRYAYNKLGQDDYNSAFIYSLKYNF